MTNQKPLNNHAIVTISGATRQAAGNDRPGLTNDDRARIKMAGFDDIGQLAPNEKRVFCASLKKFEVARQAFLRSWLNFVQDPLISQQDKWDEMEGTASAVTQIAKMSGVTR